jgi:hypothetical protein
MARIALVTVSDEGAAEMVRAALVDAGIVPEFERVYLDPYRVTALAESWRVYVPSDRFLDAQNALARLEHEMVEEVEAQSKAWQARADQPPEMAPPRRWRPSRQAVLWTLALTALFPFLAICLYARRELDPGGGGPTVTRQHQSAVPSVLRLLRHTP